MIVEAQLTNFRCLEDVKVKLTPLHAIVGPNDSGKSSFLYAVNETFNKSRTVQGCVLQFFDDKVPDSARGVLLKLQAGRLQQLNAPTSGRRDVGFQSREGDGLAAIYDAIAGRAPEALVSLKGKVRALFPSVVNLRIYPPHDGSSKAIVVETPNSTQLPLAEYSEGLAYYLAFASLAQHTNTQLFCIEEPENGLHPARIKEVMQILRDLTENGSQVLIATHSPLVLNCLEADEVTVFRRPKGGPTEATLLQETPHFMARRQVYSLGELWLSYCDGEIEDALFSDKV